MNFIRKNRNLDPKENKRSLFKLKTSAEYLKHILSTMERAHCSIDALCDGIDFDYYLTRQRFEGASQKLYESSLQPIDEILNRNSLKTEQIDKVSDSDEIKIAISDQNSHLKGDFMRCTNKNVQITKFN